MSHAFTFQWLGRYLLLGHRGWGRRKWMRRPLEERIAIEARRLRDELGISAVAALAAAEAVEFGRDHHLLYDRVEYDSDALRWWGIYETRDQPAAQIKVPLYHATEATQRGIAALN